MKVKLFAKENKPNINEIINYLNHHFKNIEYFFGSIKDAFPKEAFEGNQDILISYISPWLIPKEILEKTKLWNINFHPGPPEYPGIGCFNFSIYNEDKYYGVTAHIMEEKVDSGKIIKVLRFPILKTDTVLSLSIKSYSYLYGMFIEIIDYILLNDKIPECDEIWKRKPFTRKELEKLCELELNMSEDEIKKRIKATYYNGMPGPYIKINNYKFEYNPKR